MRLGEIFPSTTLSCISLPKARCYNRDINTAEVAVKIGNKISALKQPGTRFCITPPTPSRVRPFFTLKRRFGQRSPRPCGQGLFSLWEADRELHIADRLILVEFLKTAFLECETVSEHSVSNISDNPPNQYHNKNRFAYNHIPTQPWEERE